MSKTPVPILLVEDDDALREATGQALAMEGYAVDQFADAEAALRSYGEDFAGVVVTDIRLPGMDGLELFARLREVDDEAQVIFTTGHGDVPMAVEAMKRGATDFFTKPFSSSQLVRAVRNAAERRGLIIENRKLRVALRRQGEERLLGTSKHAERLRRTVGEVARADVDVVVTGAPGTGKTFVARLIHELGPRNGRPLVTVDAGVLSHGDAELLMFGRDRSDGLSRSGLLERAQGGTLLFEGIEAVSEPLRSQIYAFFENRTFRSIGAERPRSVDARVVAVERDGNSASLGPDPVYAELHHRLGGIAIALPTLADRREDIPEIFRHFVRRAESDLAIAAGPIGEREWAHLLSHDWDGNLRELDAFARSFVLGLTRHEQPTAKAHGGTLRELVAQFEKSVLDDALRAAEGRISVVEESLGLPRKTLYDKLARYRLRPTDYRGG